MPRRIILSVFAVAATATSASAADLAVQSPIGAIFEETVEVRPYVYRTREHFAPIIPYNLLPPTPWGRGRLSSGPHLSSYYPAPSYGGPYDPDGPRLPYVCVLYGYC